MNSLSMSIGPFYMIATWVLVGFSTYALIKLFIPKKQNNNKEESDIDILKKRYAKGEIDSVEFHKIKSDLQKS
jgi:putative membrane protein